MPCSAVRDAFGVGDGSQKGVPLDFVDGSLLVLEVLTGVFARGVLFAGGGVVDFERDFPGALAGVLGLGLVACGGSIGENCDAAARTRSLRAGDFDIVAF